MKKFFLFMLVTAAVAAAVKFLRGRQSDFDDDWQELPPPEGEEA